MVNFFVVKERKVVNLLAVISGKLIHCQVVNFFVDIHSMVKDISDYRWSSYHEYLGQPGICDIDFAFGMFSADRMKAIQLFKEFNFAQNQDCCLDYDQNIRLNDVEASAFIKSISFVENLTEVQYLEKKKRNEIIKACKEKGISLRQIARLTGVSVGVIRAI